MTASVSILHPRKPTRLRYATAWRERLASITYPPELLPVADLGNDVSIIVSCNRPDCIGEGCENCEVRKP